MEMSDSKRFTKKSGRNMDLNMIFCLVINNAILCFAILHIKTGHGNPNVQIKDAKYGQFPNIVLLLGNPSCMGTVLHRYWVLTAAHCFEVDAEPSSYTVMQVDLHETNEGYKVQKIYIHPSYETSKKTQVRIQEYDIALLRLKLAYNGGTKLNISFIPLEEDDTISKMCRIFGFSNDNGNVLQIAHKLQYVDVTGHLWWQCMPMSGQKADLMNNLVCGISKREARRPCSGNPGSPLLCKRDFAQTIVGISGWNFDGIWCGGPSRYVDVGFHAEWITSVINPGMIEINEEKKETSRTIDDCRCNANRTRNVIWEIFLLFWYFRYIQSFTH